MASFQWHGEQITKLIENELSKRVMTAAQEVKEAVRSKIGISGRVGKSGIGRSRPGNPPHAWNNNLTRAIFAQRQSKFEAIVGVPKINGVNYGTFLEEGRMRIRSKRGRMAIPWSREAISHAENGGSPLNFPIKLNRLERPGRAALLIEKRKTRFVIHYILARQVNLYPRPFLQPTMEEMQGRIEEILTAPISL